MSVATAPWGGAGSGAPDGAPRETTVTGAVSGGSRTGAPPDSSSASGS